MHVCGHAGIMNVFKFVECVMPMGNIGMEWFNLNYEL
jgi:hypothetical protein